MQIISLYQSDACRRGGAEADVLASRAHIYYREFLQNTLHGFRLIENQQHNIITSFSFFGYAKNDLYTFKSGQVGN